MRETHPPVTVACSLAGFIAVKTVVNIKEYAFIFSRHSIFCANSAWERGMAFINISLAKNPFQNGSIQTHINIYLFFLVLRPKVLVRTHE